jgi:hypothetical protein
MLPIVTSIVNGIRINGMSPTLVLPATTTFSAL